MDHDFWRQKWRENAIAFHEGAPNAFLVKHLGALSLQPGARLFLPLCGKTRDIHWFLAQGFRVAGAELSEIAVTDLFAELGVEPTKRTVGALTQYSAPGLDIYQGDIFALDAATLGAVDAIYDRAALIALPEAMRADYAKHLVAITNTAPQLLISVEYAQSQLAGPPFSVPEAAIRALYGDAYDIAVLERAEVAGGLKGRCAATELALVLRAR